MLLNVRKFNSSEITAPLGLEKMSAFLKNEPLDLEIGCGVGFHPIQYAKENPNRFLVAIEHTREKFQSFERRHLSHPTLTNLLPVHADAVRWVTHALPASSIDRIFLLYPNPEPKAANQRWLRRPFFEKLLEVLKPGGTLQLATNIERYMDEALDYGANYWKMKIIERRAFTQGHLPFKNPRTHFEKKYLARGETCFDVTFMKT